MKLFLLFLLVRQLSVFLVRTFYVPDEYWQSLEVGYKFVYGRGSLTWEWDRGIRSSFYPLFIAGIYKILNFFAIDTVEMLIYTPRVFQALLSAYADLRFYHFAGKSKWSVFMIITSWFWFYVGSRTLSNSLETALTTIALSYFPWNRRNESTVFLIPVILSAFLRPTSVIPWIVLCIYHLRKSNVTVFELILKRYIPYTVFIGGLSALVDSWYYGRWIFTPYEFFKVNAIEGIGAHYGTRNFAFYFIEGLPVLLGIVTVPFVFALIDIALKRKYQDVTVKVNLMGAIIFTLIVYSFFPHKEYRFILQILPMAMYIANDFLKNWSQTANTIVVWIVALAILLGNFAPAIYLGVVHNKGSLEVMEVLRDSSADFKQREGVDAKILFLMPCHSTPAYSYMHNNATLRFLSCNPNLKNQPGYVDEADDFYNNPSSWLRRHQAVHPVKSNPSHVVMYDVLAPQLSDFLSIYKPVHTIFNADYVSGRVGKNIIVYERIDVTQKPPSQPKEPKPSTSQEL